MAMAAPRPTDRSTFEPQSLADRRAWLAANHDSETEVWPVYRNGDGNRRI